MVVEKDNKVVLVGLVIAIVAIMTLLTGCVIPGFDALDNLGNVTENITGEAQNAVSDFDWTLTFGGFVLIFLCFIVLYFFKKIIANAIIGIVALLIIVYALGIPIPLTPLIILVSVLGGLGGVGAVMIAFALGWI